MLRNRRGEVISNAMGGEESINNIDLVAHNSSDLSFDLDIKRKMAVSKNHLKINIVVSVLLLAFLCLPYFLPWYVEESSIQSSQIYFGLTTVWVPHSVWTLKNSVLDEAPLLLSEADYMPTVHYTHT